MSVRASSRSCVVWRPVPEDSVWGVGVQGKDGITDEILDEPEGAARSRVVGVRDATGAEWSLDHIVSTDDRRADRGEQLVWLHGPMLEAMHHPRIRKQAAKPNRTAASSVSSCTEAAAPTDSTNASGPLGLAHSHRIGQRRQLTVSQVVQGLELRPVFWGEVAGIGQLDGALEGGNRHRLDHVQEPLEVAGILRVAHACAGRRQLQIALPVGLGDDGVSVDGCSPTTTRSRGEW